MNQDPDVNDPLISSQSTQSLTKHLSVFRVMAHSISRMSVPTDTERCSYITRMTHVNMYPLCPVPAEHKQR